MSLDLSYSGSSFFDLLIGRFPSFLTRWEGLKLSPEEIGPIPKGTTVLALKYREGSTGNRGDPDIDATDREGV